MHTLAQVTINYCKRLVKRDLRASNGKSFIIISFIYNAHNLRTAFFNLPFNAKEIKKNSLNKTHFFQLNCSFQVEANIVNGRQTVITI